MEPGAAGHVIRARAVQNGINLSEGAARRVSLRSLRGVAEGAARGVEQTPRDCARSVARLRARAARPRGRANAPPGTGEEEDWFIGADEDRAVGIADG